MFTQKEAKRIFPYISIDNKTECWNWTRQLYEGYGKIYFRGRPWAVHRLLYLWKFKELPKYDFSGNFVIDHLCSNRACCNPDHLHILSNRENVLSGKGPTAINARKILCKRGHELSPRGYMPGRKCMTCQKSEHSKAIKREYDKTHLKEKRERRYRKSHGFPSSQS